MAEDFRGEPRSQGEAGDADLTVVMRPLVGHFGRPFVQGDVLFREGDPSTHAYVVFEGKVRLLKRVRTIERSLSVLRPGDLFGEGAILDGAARHSTAVAIADGILLALDKPALRSIVGTYPQVAERIFVQLVRRLRDAEDQIEVLMLRDTQSKVVSALLKLAGTRSGPLELAVSPVDLSTRVGLDVETVKRTVQRLRDQQYLRISGERIEIPDVDALRRLYSLLGAKEEVRGDRSNT